MAMTERQRLYQQEYRKKNKEKLRERDHKKTIERKRKWRSDNPDKLLEQNRRYRAKNPEKNRAQDKLRKHVKKGAIQKPDNCQLCNRFGYVEAHHADYSRALNVIWVCKICHAAVHMIQKESITGGING